MFILVVNSGSSSVKFQLFDASDLSVAATGMVEQIGGKTGLAHVKYRDTEGTEQKIEKTCFVPSHQEAMEVVSELMRHTGHTIDELGGIGHRVVHGGESFKKPVLIDAEVLKTIEELVPLAPLHNPANLTGIRIATERAPHIPQVAVFDTAFHQTIPEHAYLYALPYRLYTELQVRRYGFHGTSHHYVSRQAAGYLDIQYEKAKIITLHLGNGASAAAIDAGRCVDTSMGMTPLEGLIMGTRSGDIDPAILFYLAREADMSIQELDDLLNKSSGLKGICDENDMRTITQKAEEGDSQAELALRMFCYRIRKYTGAYLAALGGADCIVFTGGIGENSAVVRKNAMNGLERLGIEIDSSRNNARAEGIMRISTDDSKVTILVVPTDEELEIAIQTLKVIKENKT
jgi:acetate kinase